MKARSFVSSRIPVDFLLFSQISLDTDFHAECSMHTKMNQLIGNRRWINGLEMHPQGPSAGPTMTSIHCRRAMKLVGCASDWKDFYHQAAVSRERAFSNILPFRFPAVNWTDSKAFHEMIEVESRPFSRERSPTECSQRGFLLKTRLRQLLEASILSSTATTWASNLPWRATPIQSPEGSRAAQR